MASSCLRAAVSNTKLILKRWLIIMEMYLQYHTVHCSVENSITPPACVTTSNSTAAVNTAAKCSELVWLNPQIYIWFQVKDMLSVMHHHHDLQSSRWGDHTADAGGPICRQAVTLPVPDNQGVMHSDTEGGVVSLVNNKMTLFCSQ